MIKVDLSIGTLPAATHNVIRGLPGCVSFGRAVGQWPAWTARASDQLSLMLRVPKIVRLRTISEENLRMPKIPMAERIVVLTRNDGWFGRAPKELGDAVLSRRELQDRIIHERPDQAGNEQPR